MTGSHKDRKQPCMQPKCNGKEQYICSMNLCSTQIFGKCLEQYQTDDRSHLTSSLEYATNMHPESLGDCENDDGNQSNGGEE